ncbi:MAG: signal peptidase II [Anaerolineae bacterium]|nr:signal peptidase II [Anaerolineae bacterium]
MKLIRNRLLLGGIAAAVLIADQLSKLWVVNHLTLYTSIDYIPWLRPILLFTYVTNTGVAFGMFPQLGDLFAVLNILIVVGIFIFEHSLSSDDLWTRLSLGLITGGAIGNLIDRFVRGSVVDFLDFNFWPLYNWGIFNLADASIVMGVILLLIVSFFLERTEMAEAPADA